MLNQKDYTSVYKPTWCSGCGNYSINPATKMALAELGIPPHQVAMVFGIGCSSNGANFYHLYAFHSLHGRSVPVAVGVKLANHELTVIADAGDGDSYGEGVNHFIHTCRTNIDLTYLVHDNRMYSLTKGQLSPTAATGTKTKTTPFGSLDEPFHPVPTALVQGATFVAQAYSGDILHLKEIIKKAITHKGFAVVNILQLCPTLNKINTLQWYKDKLYKLEDAGHDPHDFAKALTAATQSAEKIPIGIFYQVDKLVYEQQLPQLDKAPLVRQPIAGIDISASLKVYD